MRLQRTLASTLITFVAFTAVSCEPSALVKDLPTLIGKMQDDKDLIESFVHDLKANPAKSPDPRMELVQAQYAEARAAQQAYFSAVRVVWRPADTAST